MDVFGITLSLSDLLDPKGLMLIILGVLVVWAAITDFRVRRIPNIVCALTACSGIVWQILYAGQLPLAFAAAFAVLAVGFLLNMKGIFGAGDVKLIAALTIWAGPNGALVFLLQTLIAGGVVSILWLRVQPFFATLNVYGVTEGIRSTKELPFALPIAAGTFFMIFRIWPGA